MHVQMIYIKARLCTEVATHWSLKSWTQGHLALAWVLAGTVHSSLYLTVDFTVLPIKLCMRSSLDLHRSGLCPGVAVFIFKASMFTTRNESRYVLPRAKTIMRVYLKFSWLPLAHFFSLYLTCRQKEQVTCILRFSYYLTVIIRYKNAIVVQRKSRAVFSRPSGNYLVSWSQTLTLCFEICVYFKYSRAHTVVKTVVTAPIFM